MNAANLAGCRLYGILDLGYVAVTDARRVATEMIDGGVDILQLRAKDRTLPEISTLARALHEITLAARVPLVINDHPSIARDLGAEGTHIGQDDISIGEARRIAGLDCFVGKSTHSLEQAKNAQAEGADYIGFGPLFATPTKPDYIPIGLHEIGTVHSAIKLPIFCIGGIKLSNLPHVIAAGGKRAVIVSGLLQAANVAEYARTAKTLLIRGSRF